MAVTKERRREIRIFLSSTFRDLNDERSYLMDIIFPELTRICRERDLFLTVVDLRWGVTNSDPDSIISHVMEVCFREIDRARPFFIGILGNRYGYVPRDHITSDKEREFWMKDNDMRKWFEEGYSITHMEIEYGVLSRPDMAQYSYFYFKAEESFNNKDRDHNPEELKRLHELKDKIRVENSPWHWRKEYFRNPKELGEQIKEDFIAMLNSVYPESKLSPVERERLIQKQYSKFLLRNYLPSESVIDNILKNIEEEKRVLVTGPVGIGKSSTLAYVKKKYEEEHRDALIIEHYIGAGGNDSFLGIVTRLFNEIKDYLEKRDIQIPEDYTSRSEDEVLKSLPELILTAPGWENFLLLIDGVDQLAKPTELRFLAYLPEKMKVLISSREDTDATEYLSAFSLKNVKLGSISKEMRIEIIKNILRDQGKELKESQIDQIASTPATGNPLYLRVLMDELSKIHELSGPGEDQDAFVNRQIRKYLDKKDTEELFNAMLDRIEEDHNLYFKDSLGDIGNILTSIALSRSGLSENEIISINKISS
ncbi:MAG: DUF4062 domain-containing protein, partial [Thermoplasmata archaeon]